MTEDAIKHADPEPNLIEAAISAAKDDPGAPFERNVLDALKTMRHERPDDYQRVRKQLKKADALVGELDRLTAPRRDKDDPAQGSELEFRTDEPWPDLVDGTELLDEIVETLQRFMVISASRARAVSLWVLFTYLHDVVDISPILLVTSPVKRCGKTRLVGLLSRLCRRAEVAGNISAAGVFRTIEKYSPTFIADEADTFFDENDELRGVYNSGHTRDTAYVIRVAGDEQEPRKFSTWAPKVLARIGMPKADTIPDRSIVVTLQRKTTDEKVERLRRRKVEPMLIELRRKCLRWAQDNAEHVEVAEPDLPELLHDRAADNWEPLFAIADQVGGKWPEQARQIACGLTGAEIEDDTIGVQLLADIRDVFGDRQEMASKALASELNELEDRPWPTYGKGRSGLTQHALARLLRTFKITTGTVHSESSGTRKSLMGYKLEKFEPVWLRYLPPPQDSGVQSTPARQANAGAGFSDFQSTPDIEPGVLSNRRKPNAGAGWRSGVLENPETQGDERNPRTTEPGKSPKTGDGAGSVDAELF